MAHRDFVTVEVEILEPQTQTFHQTDTQPVQQAGQQPRHPCHAIQQHAHFTTTQPHRQPLGSLRTLNIFHPVVVNNVVRCFMQRASFGANIDLADTDIVADAAAILALDEQIEALNTRIETLASDCPMTTRLRTLPGFGATGTAELAGEIGALQRFHTEASLAVYLGMAPLDHSSGLNHRSKQPKCVNSRCQAALMTCIVRHMACVPESRAYYERKRAQGKRHNQAVRALGRHLVRVIWRMLNDERDYEIKSEQDLKI